MLVELSAAFHTVDPTNASGWWVSLGQSYSRCPHNYFTGMSQFLFQLCVFSNYVLWCAPSYSAWSSSVTLLYLFSFYFFPQIPNIL